MNSIKIAVLSISATTALISTATAPDAPFYTMDECAGSLMPYPIPDHGITLPDSLTPVLMNHIGRHGARFPSSPDATMTVSLALSRADSLGTITPAGRQLRKLADFVLDISHNRWGTLDSLGMAEQRGIASRMFKNFPNLFDNGIVNAISSYAPRCMMSMYEFTHQLDRLNNDIEIHTSTGPQNSPLLRPFDINTEYLDWRKSNEWKSTYDRYAETRISRTILHRILGEDYPLDDNWRTLVLDEYHIVAGMAAMGYTIDPSEYFTPQEYNAVWSCFNLRQYLQRTATSLSAIPAEITSRLIADIITTCDDAVNGKSPVTACLRFGHAETLMPLLSQIHLPGCYYITDNFDTVSRHWKDFHVVPMASNLQIIICRSATGHYYMTVYLNEQSAELIPGDNRTIIPYSQARTYLDSCLPPALQTTETALRIERP